MKEITYGETLDLSKEPTQQDKDGGGTADSFTWDYVYYKADGTRLPSQPTDAGTYKVQAVLSSATHSGASGLKEFTIKARSIESFTFTSPAGMSLTYNKRPHTPEYTVKDGETTLKKGTDYTVVYSNNTNAGTAAVTFTGKGNYRGTKEVKFDIAKLALTEAQKPTITGTAAAGQVLSASLAGVDAGELEWIWTMNDTRLPDCTAPGYEVRAEDSNKVISVMAKARANGNYSGVSGASAEKQVSKFKVTGTVTVAATGGIGEGGRIATGTELTANANVNPSASKTGGTWSWKVNGTLKANASTAAYTVADGDKEIIAVFTPNTDYIGTIESAKLEAGKALLTGAVTVTEADGKLTAAVTGDTDGKSFVYTWLRDGQPISGASGAVYTITADDRGKTLSVKVTADGYTGELVSAGRDIQAAKPSAPAVKVRAGDRKLTVSWTAPADDGGAPVTGYRLTVRQGETVVLDDTALPADVMSYTVKDLTNGTQYTVSVMAVNRMGNGEADVKDGTPEASPAPPHVDDGGGGKPTTAPPVETDDVKVTVETLEDGTVVTTTTDSKGNVSRTENRPDGSILSTVHHADGCNGTIETDTAGKTIAVVDVPAAVAAAAVESGSAVPLPVVGIRAHRDIDLAPAMVVNTFGVNGVKVSVPVENKGLTVVAVEIKSDGTPVVVKNTIQTEDGIMLYMNDGEVIRFLDNKKFFADTEGHWAADAIDFVSSRELFNGTEPNIFAPDASMTRGMLVTVLARYENVDTEGGAIWYEKGAAWAVDNGLSDGTRLNDNISREQLATIMYRYAILKGRMSGAGVSLSGYTDANLVSDWAADAMSWAVGAGLINGTTPTTLDPQGSATRAQVAAIIMRYAQIFGL